MACSGMLPGYVSGIYTHEDCHVDLNRLAHYANARLILQPATGLDMQVALSGQGNAHMPDSRCLVMVLECGAYQLGII